MARVWRLVFPTPGEKSGLSFKVDRGLSDVVKSVLFSTMWDSCRVVPVTGCCLIESCWLSRYPWGEFQWGWNQ